MHPLAHAAIDAKLLPVEQEGCEAVSNAHILDRVILASRPAMPSHLRGFIIGDHGRTYTDDEFALILAKAAELSARSTSQGGPSRGLSLLEIKAVAKEVGLDPELIERAAHLVPGTTRFTVMGRLFGGPLSSQLDFHVPVRLTQEDAQQLLSLVRGTLLTQGRGEATATGMSFSSWEDGLKVFVSAHADGHGTRIRMVIDNRSRLVMPLTLALLGTMVVAIVTPDGGPFVLGGGMAIVTGWVWRSIRKTVQRTLGTLDDLVDALSRYVRGEDAS